ncbi:MAG TPA: S41 family peptidase, partial [Thermoanaerobaculia bacterium]|nr:S41 family peptidase [Thermoanaerobaculia bacterium]
SSVKLGAYDWRADASFASTELPSPEQRILAAFRLWNVIHFFHGSRDRLGAWNLSLGTIADKLADAQTRRDYELALAESLAMGRDMAASVETPSLVALHGAAAPPFELMQVEGKPVVTMSASEQVKPGDELLRIDGRDATLRLNELARYTAEANAVRDLAKGAAGTTSLFAFRRADGSQYEVPLARGANVVANPAKAWRILNGNVAYVDARTLDDLDALFNEVASTRAMIIDLRGEHVNAELVQRLNVTGNAVTSRVPVLLGGAYNFADAAETIAATTGARYDRPTIALVDERTPADVALALQALARTRFVGTAMAGAHGDTSSLVVPGNITIRFTATELHNAKGRAGIEPDFMVERTIRGLAEGRDELLDAALAILQ